MGSFTTGNLKIAILVFVLAYITKTLYQQTWLFKEIHLEDFESTPPYTILEVPTTYYSHRHLKDVLNGWYKSDRPYFHLYRMKDPENFVVNFSSINSPTLARRYDPNCEHNESVICRMCFAREPTSIQVQDILGPESSDYYAAFAKLEDAIAISSLFNLLEIPGINQTKILFEHAFISNFEKDTITAAWHANAMSSSLAIQFVGSKTWLFVSPRITLGSDYFFSSIGAGLVTPVQSPRKPYELYVYKSLPGDILFFSEAWSHTVMTHRGPNVMINFRQVEPRNFLRNPILWLHGFMNSRIFPNQRPTDAKSKERDFKNYLYDLAQSKVGVACGSVEKQRGNSAWDEEMADLLKSNKHNP